MGEKSNHIWSWQYPLKRSRTVKGTPCLYRSVVKFKSRSPRNGWKYCWIIMDLDLLSKRWPAFCIIFSSKIEGENKKNAWSGSSVVECVNVDIWYIDAFSRSQDKFSKVLQWQLFHLMIKGKRLTPCSDGVGLPLYQRNICLQSRKRTVVWSQRHYKRFFIRELFL